MSLYDDPFYRSTPEYTEQQREIDYAYFCQNVVSLKSMEDAHYKWSKRARRFLLTELGPRIARIDGRNCIGSREMINRVAHNLHELNRVIQFSANHVDKTKRNKEACLFQPMNLDRLVSEVLDDEREIAWRDAHPGHTYDDYTDWRDSVEKAKTRKRFLRGKRLERASRKYQAAHPRPDSL